MLLHLENYCARDKQREDERKFFEQTNKMKQTII